MKVFVTGVGGQLGYDVVNELLSRGHDGIGSDISCGNIWLDITDKEAVEEVLTSRYRATA